MVFLILHFAILFCLFVSMVWYDDDNDVTLIDPGQVGWAGHGHIPRR